MDSLCVIAFAAAAAVDGGGAAFEAAPLAPRIELVTYASGVLGVRRRFAAVLPDGYGPLRGGWPVLYILHGRGRDERSLVDDPEAREVLLGCRAVVILPDGDDGWYIDSPVRRADRHEEALDEVIRLADARYRISGDRMDRGIAGWSMGGYGCLRYATRHPEQFGVVAPMIGLVDFPREGLPEGFSYAVPVERFGPDPERWPALNPMHDVGRLAGAAILLVTAESAFDRVMNENAHRRLLELDLPHRFEILAGGHTFPVVRAALKYVVGFMNEAVTRRDAADADPATAAEPTGRP